MLSISHTENLTGARISGDYWDLDEIKEACYAVVGDENKYYDWEGPRVRVLSVCHDIHQALQGDRHVDFVGNGFTKESMVHHDMVASEKNIYYATEVLWPELIFTTIALNDFVRLYAKDHQYPSLDVHITAIRKFQSIVGDALLTVLPKNEHDQFMNLLSQDKTNVQDYAIQFVDMLNLNYINASKEQREKNLGMMALKLAVQDKDYQAFRNQVVQSANKTKSDIHDMSINKKYPEEIEW